jgi:hypothetical protein
MPELVLGADILTWAFVAACLLAGYGETDTELPATA